MLFPEQQSEHDFDKYLRTSTYDRAKLQSKRSAQACKDYIFENGKPARDAREVEWQLTQTAKKIARETALAKLTPEEIEALGIWMPPKVTKPTP